MHQSQNVGPCETLPEINLLQVQVPSQNNTRARKMHCPQSGCYDHLTSEIWLKCQTVLNVFRIFFNFRSVLLNFDHYNVKNSFQNIFQTFWFIDFKILIVLVFSILDQNPFSSISIFTMSRTVFKTYFRHSDSLILKFWSFSYFQS